MDAGPLYGETCVPGPQLGHAMDGKARFLPNTLFSWAAISGGNGRRGDFGGLAGSGWVVVF